MPNTIIMEYVTNGLKGKSPTTQKSYEYALIQFETWLEGAGTDLEGFSRSDVQQYIDYLAARKKAAATINKIFHAIKSFGRWAGKPEITSNIRVIKPKNILNEAPSSLTRAERLRLIRDIDRSGSPRDYAIVITALNTGLRLSELVALDRSDIEISERKGLLLVRSGKGCKERVIPMNSETRRALTSYLETRSDNLDALFLSNRFQRISNRSVQNIVEKHGVNFHALRHTFITELVRSGRDFSIIQSLTGHNNADMLLRYSRPSEEDKQIALEALFSS